MKFIKLLLCFLFFVIENNVLGKSQNKTTVLFNNMKKSKKQNNTMSKNNLFNNVGKNKRSKLIDTKNNLYSKKFEPKKIQNHNSLLNKKIINTSLTPSILGLYSNNIFNKRLINDALNSSLLNLYPDNIFLYDFGYYGIDYGYNDGIYNIFSEDYTRSLRNNMNNLMYGHFNDIYLDLGNFDDHFNKNNKHYKALHPFKKLLNKFRLHVFTGIGYTNYKNRINGFSIYKDDDKSLYINAVDLNHHTYQTIKVGWFGLPYEKLNDFKNPDFYNYFNNKMEYKGDILSVPILSLGLSTDFLERLRLEIDFTLTYNYVRKLKQNYQLGIEDNTRLDAYNKYSLDEIEMPNKHFLTNEYSILPGFKIVNNTLWSIIFHMKLFFSTLQHNKNYFEIIDGSFTHNKAFLPGIGACITLESHLSDYFTIFGRLTYQTEQWNFESKIGNGEDNNKRKVLIHYFNKMLFQFGINFTTSYIDECKVDNCDIENLHLHNGKTYTGLGYTQYRNRYGQIVHRGPSSVTIK